MPVIIISELDAHIPFVDKHLSGPPIIIDVQEVIDGAELSYAFIHGKLRVFYRGKELTDITGVWFRRPREPRDRIKGYVSKQHVEYAASALMRLMDVLYTCFPEATWVSDRFAIKRAESKPYQQVVAQAVGFNVPNTLYTTSAIRAQTFVKACDQAIVKSLSVKAPYTSKKKTLSFYTRKIPPDMSYQGLNLAPAIFQQALNPKREFRVTVVGDKVFAACVHALRTDADSTVRDWRISHIPKWGSITFTEYKLTKTIERKCVSIVRKLGLVYGAIDFIEDKDGVWWFLEINPNGQWAFVEEETGQPIGKALADLLEGNS